MHVMPIRRSIHLAVTLLLAACTGYWAKPGATPVDLAAARAVCAQRADAAYPPSMGRVTMSTGTPAPMVTRCAPSGATVACTTTGTGFSPPTETTLDQNTGPR